MSSPEHDISELLTAFVDGELSAADTRTVTEMTQTNPEIHLLVAAERAVKRLITTRTRQQAAPAALGRRIRGAIFAQADRHKAVSKPKRWSLRWLLTQSPAAASVAGAALLIAALTIALTLFGAERITPYVRDVYAHHTQLDDFPIRIEGTHEAVAEQASKAVDFPITVPRLGDEFTLQGARKCALCGHGVAFIKYEGTQGLVSFFVIPRVHPALWHLEKHPEGATSFYTADHEGVQMAFWHESEATYCVAAVLPQERVIGLARTAHEQVGLTRPLTRETTTAPPVLIARQRALRGH